MEEHVKRLVVERDELSDKLKKLSEFMKSDTFKKLDEDDKMILKIQKDSMKTYKRALSLRIYWEIQQCIKPNDLDQLLASKNI